MAVIVDLRKDIHTAARLIQFLIGLSLLLAGLGGCNSKIAEDCSSTRDVWTSVKGRNIFTRTVHESRDNYHDETVYELQLVADGSKLLAVKHVKESAHCGLKEAKDFVDTYCDCVL